MQQTLPIVRSEYFSISIVQILNQITDVTRGLQVRGCNSQSTAASTFRFRLFKLWIRSMIWPFTSEAATRTITAICVCNSIFLNNLDNSKRLVCMCIPVAAIMLKHVHQPCMVFLVSFCGEWIIISKIQCKSIRTVKICSHRFHVVYRAQILPPAASLPGVSWYYTRWVQFWPTGSNATSITSRSSLFPNFERGNSPSSWCWRFLWFQRLKTKYTVHQGVNWYHLNQLKQFCLQIYVHFYNCTRQARLRLELKHKDVEKLIIRNKKHWILRQRRSQLTLDR
jgi:hypothetical protein